MISKIITDEQINKIHKSSVEILERIGVIVPHEMINKFIEAGAIVDRKTQCVKISEKLIMKSLEQCGKQWTIYGVIYHKRQVLVLASYETIIVVQVRHHGWMI